MIRLALVGGIGSGKHLFQNYLDIQYLMLMILLLKYILIIKNFYKKKLPKFLLIRLLKDQLIKAIIKIKT